MPDILGLKQATWKNLSPADRLETLQQLENTFAAQDERAPCEVFVIPDNAFKSLEQRELLQGFHPFESREIYINEALVNTDAPHVAVYSDGTQVNANDPYMAVETLLHEDRHAHQEYLAHQRPDLAESPLQLEDFQKNGAEGYLSSESFDPEYYLMQPIERDARAFAREGMDELYSSQNGVVPSYIEHSERMQTAETGYAEIAEDYLGENYEDVVRQKAFEQYEVYQSESHAETSQMAEQSELSDTVIPEIDNDYFYGYGQ